AEGRDDSEPFLDRSKLPVDAHSHVVALPLWRAFGMKADEVEPRAGLACDVILLVRTVLKKEAQELCGFWIGRAGAVRSANASFWQGAQNGVDAKIVELEELFRRSLPVVDIGLVPDFP